MSKTAPGPKELAQRAMQEKRVIAGNAMSEHERAMATRKSRPKPLKKTTKPRAKIPYAGKPKGNENASAYGVKHREGKTK